MISKELNAELDRMQVELRKLLNDDTLVLRETDTMNKLLKKFDFTFEFLETKDIMSLDAQSIRYRQELGLITVPVNHEAGRDFMLKRGVAAAALQRLRESANASV